MAACGIRNPRVEAGLRGGAGRLPRARTVADCVLGRRLSRDAGMSMPQGRRQFAGHALGAALVEGHSEASSRPPSQGKIATPEIRRAKNSVPHRSIRNTTPRRHVAVRKTVRRQTDESTLAAPQPTIGRSKLASWAKRGLTSASPALTSSNSASYSPRGPKVGPIPTMRRSHPRTRVAEPGDLWVLGRHRLLCGDSTVATDVERVLGGVAPHLMVTDPPYSVQFTLRQSLRILV
jgi:hypothetical protein